MIQSFEVAEHDIAFYSGVLIAVFTFGEFLTSVIWAWVSDKVGWKPTLDYLPVPSSKFCCWPAASAYLDPRVPRSAGHMPVHPVTGLSVLQVLKKLFTRRHLTKIATYTPLVENSAGLQAQEDATEEHLLEDFPKEQWDGPRASSDSETFEADGPVKELSDRAFTSKVIL
jgi:hypothetical protein